MALRPSQLCCQDDTHQHSDDAPIATLRLTLGHNDVLVALRSRARGGGQPWTPVAASESSSSISPQSRPNTYATNRENR